MTQIWYRSPEFSATAMREFEERLRRAREHNRSQYLRIKVVTLMQLESRDADSTAAVLLQRLLRDYSSSRFEVNFAREELGRIHERAGRLIEAEQEYRRGDDGTCAFALAELIIKTKQVSKYPEAALLLRKAAESGAFVLFNLARFRFCVASAKLAKASGSAHDAAAFAQKALDIAAIRTPQFSRHPTIGLVNPDLETLNELRMLANVTALTM